MTRPLDQGLEPSPSSGAAILSATAIGEGVPGRGIAYRLSGLAILLIANVLNYADRALLSGLARPLQRDFSISNAELGFLFGTSFVLFNSLFGLALGRLADRWWRNRLLLIGVGTWSAMTVLSAFATSYNELVMARIGVGIGEAAIGGVGYSMLADIFPARQRAAAFAVFLCGPFIGVSLALSLGGQVVEGWALTCGGLGLCDFKDWQAAFLIFGAPGVLVALLCGLLGEPRQARGAHLAHTRTPVADALYELSLIIPPFSVIRLWRLVSRRMAFINLAAAGLLVLCCAALTAVTGSLAQWSAVGVGLYGLFSWCQAQVRRDPELFSLTAGSVAFFGTILACGLMASATASMSFWSVPFATKELGFSAAEAGHSLGIAIGGGSLLGTVCGGFIVDLWRRTNRAAALDLGLIAGCTAAALLAFLLLSPSHPVLLVTTVAVLMFVLTIWPAGCIALLQDLVTPGMRAQAATLYVTTTSLLAGSIGPYAVGRLADALGSIRLGLTFLFALLPVSLLLFLLARRDLPRALRRKAEAETGAAIEDTL